MLATPSMLQSGISRELFDMWCTDSKHGVIIADFAVQVGHFDRRSVKERDRTGNDGKTDFGKSFRGVQQRRR